ncbi:unnamed protein product [Cylindrotheca closterium]|uniref:Galactosyltransferase C-terminal domain-containing protein n=1 Tax=Cylindrotheca closterium TaxID=2856 RepID=A0AAD2G5S1_9STRA|nr:unnamed protein product [Cylindrotheca closterium]
MSKLIRSERRGNRQMRRKQLLQYALLGIVFMISALVTNQDLYPTKLMKGTSSYKPTTFLKTKERQSTSTRGNAHATKPSQNPATDPSTIPFDEDYLPPRKTKEKWRNRRSTGVRMGVHKLKQTPKVIFSEIEQAATDTDVGISPNNSISEVPSFLHVEPMVHYHAIVVPYRNRQYHLQEFQKRLYPYIEKHYRHPAKGQQQHVSEFSLWIIEQDDDEPFNRGWLGNVGIAEILRHSPEVECLTFHDVDFVPEDTGENDAVKGPVYYDRCSVPTQTGSELFRTGLNWTVGYQEHAGGVVTLHLQHWQAINGFSNDYVSWGGEDDDLYLRLRDKKLLSVNRQRKFLMRRPPPGFGRFRTVSDDREHHIQDTDKGKNANYQVSLQILQQVRDGIAQIQRSDYDGLSDLQYKVNSHKVRRPTSSPSSGYGFQMAHHLKVKQQLLELIPIPGTGAEQIEKAASSLGIPWGRCHFQQDDDEDDFDFSGNHNTRDDEVEKGHCSNIPDFANLGLTTHHRGGSHDGNQQLWHLPSYLWDINMFEGKHTFTIVRNPFDLVIMRYLELIDPPLNGKGAGNIDSSTSPNHHEKELNEFVESNLCRGNEPFSTKAEPMWWFPQYDFVHFNRTQRVNHILKYESLASEFPNLMTKYDLPLDLPNFETRAEGAGPQALSLQNLTNRSIALIQLHHARDFQEFGYPKALSETDKHAVKMDEQGRSYCVFPSKL